MNAHKHIPCQMSLLYMLSKRPGVVFFSHAAFGEYALNGPVSI